MGSSKRSRYRPYLPYIKEGLFCLALDFGVWFICIALLCPFLNKDNLVILLFFPLYLLLECFLNYRIMLLSILEVYLNLYKRENLQLIKAKKALEFVGKWEPVLPKFYPQHKYVEKSIVYFKRADGSVIKLRCVFYGLNGGRKNTRRKDRLSEVLCSLNEEAIEYGRLSKVIISRNNGMQAGKDGLWDRARFPVPR